MSRPCYFTRCVFHILGITRYDWNRSASFFLFHCQKYLENEQSITSRLVGNRAMTPMSSRTSPFRKLYLPILLKVNELFVIVVVELGVSFFERKKTFGNED